MAYTEPHCLQSFPGKHNLGNLSTKRAAGISHGCTCVSLRYETSV